MKKTTKIAVAALIAVIAVALVAYVYIESANRKDSNS